MVVPSAGVGPAWRCRTGRAGAAVTGVRRRGPEGVPSTRTTAATNAETGVTMPEIVIDIDVVGGTGHVVVPEVVRVIAGAGQEATRDLAVDHVTAPDPDLDLERGAGADHAALIKILDLDRAVVLLLKKTETPQRKIRTNLV
jgi:hypothetical protein